MQTRTVRTVVYLAAGIGMVISIFAAAELLDTALRSVCSYSAFFSCSAVDASGKTTFLWIPDYAWGIGGFIGIMVVNALAESRPDDNLGAYGLLALTTAGIGLALYFLYVELALINAFCVVCFAAYLAGFAAWAGAIELTRRTRIANALA
ncbi:MAG TPA: vitamin K epoxide reductase family protein [Thermoplasmata archaeon]|nr:vitamin K epoxide reductase family protein [Thermoplasmata archaeon]